VEIASLTATSVGSNAKLRWTTMTETNAFGFGIERRAISNAQLRMDDWMDAGFVQGHGTTSSVHEYSFTDKNLSPGTYSYRIKKLDNSGKFSYTVAVEVTVNLAPKEFTLSQNYPNPFNPSTRIDFTTSARGQVTLKVFNILGKEVATLANGEMEAGFYQVTFDASKLSSGVYFYRLATGKFTETRRLMFLK
jgi:hypothetical protein